MAESARKSRLWSLNSMVGCPLVEKDWKFKLSVCYYHLFKSIDLKEYENKKTNEQQISHELLIWIKNYLLNIFIGSKVKLNILRNISVSNYLCDLPNTHPLTSLLSNGNKQEVNGATRSPERQWLYIGVQRILYHMASVKNNER